MRYRLFCIAVFIISLAIFDRYMPAQPKPTVIDLATTFADSYNQWIVMRNENRHNPQLIDARELKLWKESKTKFHTLERYMENQY